MAPARFEEHLRSVVRAGSVEDVLPTLQTDDLYLACACLDGDRAALSAFDAAFAGTIGQVLSRFGLSDADRQDVAQALRVSFFVKKSLAGYSGRGALRGWVRAAATRGALDLIAARKKRPDDEDEILANLQATGDPELDALRGAFVKEFRAAFAQTLEALAPEDRSFLAQHYVDDLGIDQLAALHGIHRATAARRAARLRADLLEGTRSRLMGILRVDGAGFDSLMRAAGSKLQVSVFRMLKS